MAATLTVSIATMSARPFTETEYRIMIDFLAAEGRTRDRLLIILGCASGLRIRELTSLTCAQLWDTATGDVVREVTIARRNLKGGRSLWQRSIRGRRVPLAEPVRTAIREYLTERGAWTPEAALFATCRSGTTGRPLHRSQAWRIIAGAAAECGIQLARISTHSLRKTFVGRAYRATGNDLIATQRIVGHASPLHDRPLPRNRRRRTRPRGAVLGRLNRPPPAHGRRTRPAA